MRKRGYGVFLQCPITGKQLSFVGYAFVDDTDLSVTDPAVNYNDTDGAIYDKMQEAVTLWEGFTRASGGAIRPDKSHWYLVDFKWKDGCWKYADTFPSPSPLQVKDNEGNLQTIEQVDINDARRTVGVRLAPDGNNGAEYKHLQEVIADWTDKAKSSRLPRSLVWTGLTSGLMRKLAFPLPATTFSKKECEELVKPLFEVACLLLDLIDTS